MAARTVVASATVAPAQLSGRSLRPAKASKPVAFVSNGNINRTTAIQVW